MNQHLQDHIISLSGAPNGLPISIVQYDANEVMARVRIVHNIVERDPDEPSLGEVREMMSEIEAEIENENANEEETL
jgi:hypothetical protein